MLWKTHIRISKEVLYRLRLPLSSEEASRLKDGVVAPDKWGDYPHHYGKSAMIRKYLMESRRFYLQNDLPSAYYNLGIALHYIQDAYTTLTSRSPNHHNWEEQIEDSRFVYDMEGLIQAKFQTNSFQENKFSRLAESLSRDVEGRDNTLNIATMVGQDEFKTWAKPIIDLNLALRVSFVVSKSVLSKRNNPELETSLNRLLKEYEDLLQNSELLLSNKIAELAQRRTDLIKRVAKGPDFKSKIQEFFLPPES